MSNRLSPRVSDEQFCRIIQIESGGDPDAAAGTSTAQGLFQFIERTWYAVGMKHYPAEVAAAGGREGWAKLRRGRSTAPLQMRMGARFTEDNVSGLGPGWQDGDLYLAHFLGLGGAKSLFRASPSASAVSVAGQQAADANRTVFYHDKGRGAAKSCAEVRAWADSRMRTAWDKAGRKDWVGIWGGPSLKPVAPTPVVAPKPVPPPERPPTPAEERMSTKTKVGTTTAVVVGSGGAAEAARQSGASVGTIIGVSIGVAVVIISVVLIVRAARRVKS